MRRLNRTVNKEDTVYPPLLSKYPLIDNNRPANTSYRQHKIVRGLPFPNVTAADEVCALRLQAENGVPRPLPIDHTKRFDATIMQNILSFVGDSPKDVSTLNSLNMAWRRATFTVVDEVCVFPSTISFHDDVMQLDRKLKGLASFFSVSTRGQHVRRLTLVDGRCVGQLPQTFKGPRLETATIQRLLVQMPNLSHLDIRGIEVQNFIPIADKFFSSLHLLTPCLRCLKVGAHFMRNWAPQWWARLPYLSEFVIGSRREDADWDDPSPLLLHEDVFSMLRSPAHVWTVVKFWVHLTPQSFSALIFPPAPFPRVVNLTVNAFGNCSLKPLEEGVQDVPKDEKKKTEKITKKGSQVDDSANSKGIFPLLIALTVVDVMERTDFSVELMARMTFQAPFLKHFNVANTLRLAPTHIEPSAAKGRKPKRAI